MSKDYAVKRCNLRKLRAKIQLRSQWQTEKPLLSLPLGRGFTLPSLLRDTRRL